MHEERDTNRMKLPRMPVQPRLSPKYSLSSTNTIPLSSKPHIHYTIIHTPFTRVSNSTRTLSIHNTPPTTLLSNPLHHGMTLVQIQPALSRLCSRQRDHDLTVLSLLLIHPSHSNPPNQLLPLQFRNAGVENHTAAWIIPLCPNVIVQLFTVRIPRLLCRYTVHRD